LSVGIKMDPPLSLGPLPHLSDPPSGINCMWKWAYSLNSIFPIQFYFFLC
jgi:hypothetical protein